MKKINLLFLSLLVILTGCWDIRDINKIGIVVAVGIDQDPETKEFILSSQIIKPSALGMEAKSGEKPYQVITTRGETMFAAIRKVAKTFDKKAFYAHNKIIVISDQLAKKGLLPVLDAFQRGTEIRGHIWLAIAKDISAQKILEDEPKAIEKIPANYLDSMIENREFQYSAATINILNYYKKTLGEGTSPLVTVITDKQMEGRNTGENQIYLSGGAVFKEDRLIGYLNEKQTRGYHRVLGEPKNGIITIQDIQDDEKKLSIEILKSNTSIHSSIEGNEIKYTFETEEMGSVVEFEEIKELKDPKERLDYLKKLEKKYEEEIKSEMEVALNTAQKEFRTDIFGLGQTLHIEHPKKWAQVKDDWENIYAEDITFSIKVKVKLNDFGLLKGPLKEV